MRDERHHQPATARRGRCQYPDFASAFGGTADMAGPAAGLVPVENDPTQSSVPFTTLFQNVKLNPHGVRQDQFVDERRAGASSGEEVGCRAFTMGLSPSFDRMRSAAPSRSSYWPLLSDHIKA